MATRFTLLAVLEALWILLAFGAALYLRAQGDPVASEMHLAEVLPRAIAFTVILLIAMVSVGLYRAHQSVAFSDTLIRLLAAALLATVVDAAVYYALPGIFTEQGTLVLASISAVALVAVNRKVSHVLVGREAYKRNVLILGNGRAAAQLTKSFVALPEKTFRLAGFVAGAGETPMEECLPRLDHSTALLDFVRANKIDEIVVALDDRRQSFPARELLHCRLAGINVTEALTFIERETGAIDLDVLRPGWLIYGRGFRRGSLHAALKRIADIVGSLSLITVTAPILLLAMLAVAVESRGRGGVFYRQRRVGFHGRTFELLKLRTMVPEAEADGYPRWAVAKDARITQTGTLLRRFRIDELPQVLNILKGEMSFVGPRPERPEFVAELSALIPYYEERHWVKPGLTGWAQVSYPYGASIEDARQKLQYDLYYVKHQSPMFDLLIILETLEVIIWGCERQSAAAIRKNRADAAKKRHAA